LIWGALNVSLGGFLGLLQCFATEDIFQVEISGYIKKIALVRCHHGLSSSQAQTLERHFVWSHFAETHIPLLVKCFQFFIGQDRFMQIAHGIAS
jgi:hypothetical protein